VIPRIVNHYKSKSVKGLIRTRASKNVIRKRHFTYLPISPSWTVGWLIGV